MMLLGVSVSHVSHVVTLVMTTVNLLAGLSKLFLVLLSEKLV